MNSRIEATTGFEPVERSGRAFGLGEAYSALRAISGKSTRSAA